jgi:hypothetical protein
MTNAAYELSRIYAKGWSAGRACTDADEDVELTIATLNPFRDGEKQQRWTLGFEDARRRSENRRGLTGSRSKTDVSATSATAPRPAQWAALRSDNPHGP